MSHDDFDFEPVRGLPKALPPDETLLWQGAPDLRSLALRVFHVRKVAIYFAALAAWRMIVVCGEDGAPRAIASAAVPSTLMGLSAVVILGALAWLVARTTVYSITSRRVVMRIGVALPITFTLPFAVLAGATLKVYPDGTGNIPLALNGGNRLSYLILWPHARPWRIARAEPTLRFVADAASVARLLSEAVAAWSPGTIMTGATTPEGHPAKAPASPSWPLAPAAA